MARSTQGDEVIKVTAVRAVNVSPLDDLRSFAFFSTVRALHRFSLFTTNPLVQPTITNRRTFPTRVIVIRQQNSKFLIMTRGVLFVAVTKFLTTFQKFVRRVLPVTSTRTIVLSPDLGRTTSKGFIAPITSEMNHVFYSSFNFGEKQYA
jgi:hypothetical protein